MGRDGKISEQKTSKNLPISLFWNVSNVPVVLSSQVSDISTVHAYYIENNTLTFL